nr:hypothetical protein [Candidatus Dadabacteria bacterium]
MKIEYDIDSKQAFNRERNYWKYASIIIIAVFVFCFGYLFFQLAKKEIKDSFVEGSIKTMSFIDCNQRMPTSVELEILRDLDLIVGCQDMMHKILDAEDVQVLETKEET